MSQLLDDKNRVDIGDHESRYTQGRETPKERLSLTEIMDLSAVIYKSSYYPSGINSKEQIAIRIMVGQELGVKPMQALYSIMVVNGRPAIWGDIGLALVRASGWLLKAEETFDGSVESDLAVAICTLWRKPELIGTYPEFHSKYLERCEKTVRSFSIADAKKAGLWNNDKKEIWKKYPQRMLQMRARWLAMRDLFPDVLGGFSSDYEANDAINVTETTTAVSVRVDPGAARVDPGHGSEMIEKRAPKGIEGSGLTNPATTEPITNPAASDEMSDSVKGLFTGAAIATSQIERITDEWKRAKLKLGFDANIANQCWRHTIKTRYGKESAKEIDAVQADELIQLLIRFNSGEPVQLLEFSSDLVPFTNKGDMTEAGKK